MSYEEWWGQMRLLAEPGPDDEEQDEERDEEEHGDESEN